MVNNLRTRTAFRLLITGLGRSRGSTLRKFNLLIEKGMMDLTTVISPKRAVCDNDPTLEWLKYEKNKHLKALDSAQVTKY